jgi:DNA ligase-1
MKYPTLYSRDSHGNVRVWWMEQNGDQYTTHAGAKGGAINVSDPQIGVPMNVGKSNETTGEQQAEKEILAQYKKKKKLKYFENEADIDKKNFFAPMLAEKLKDVLDYFILLMSTFTWVIVQIKFNGARAIARKDGIYTRKGEKYFAIPHIEESLKEHFEKYPDSILDGELYNYELREKLNELIRIVSVNRKEKDVTPELLKRSREIVQYHVYDGFKDEVMQKEDYETRQAWIDSVIENIPFLHKVKSWKVNTEKAIKELFNKAVADKQEGVMIRVLGLGYFCKRVMYLIKYKPVDDDECEIVKLNEGTGNWKGKAYTATVKWKGMEFEISLKGSMEDRENLWQEWKKNPEKITGQIRTFEYYGLNGKGKPNFAQIDWFNNSIKA